MMIDSIQIYAMRSCRKNAIACKVQPFFFCIDRPRRLRRMPDKALKLFLHNLRLPKNEEETSRSKVSPKKGTFFRGP